MIWRLVTRVQPAETLLFWHTHYTPLYDDETAEVGPHCLASFARRRVQIQTCTPETPETLANVVSMYYGVV